MSLRLEGFTTNRRADLAQPTGHRLGAAAALVLGPQPVGIWRLPVRRRGAGRVDLGDLGRRARQFLTLYLTASRAPSLDAPAVASPVDEALEPRRF
jgi:hypothetical protein